MVFCVFLDFLFGESKFKHAVFVSRFDFIGIDAGNVKASFVHTVRTLGTNHFVFVVFLFGSRMTFGFNGENVVFKVEFYIFFVKAREIRFEKEVVAFIYDVGFEFGKVARPKNDANGSEKKFLSKSSISR